MASLSDILTAIQNGVIAVNGLTQQIGVLFGLINPRRKLTAATTFYIGDGTGGIGNDSLAGTSPATAWLTFAHAAAVLGGQIDFGGQTVTLQAVAGHASFTTACGLPNWVGGGAFIFDVGGGSIALPGTGICITTPAGAIPGPITIQNGTLSAVSGDALFAQSSGEVIIGSGITWGACGNVGHIQVTQGCLIRLQSSYNITGNASRHWRVYIGGGINNFGNSMNVNVSGGLTFGSFAVVDNGGVLDLQFGGLQFTGAGAGTGSTGQKYFVSGNGVINTGGKGSEFFPGTANSGSPLSGSGNNGGQYF